MKTFCRILAALLVAVMMLSALAACDTKKTEGPDDKPTSEDAATSTGKTDEPSIGGDLIDKPTINEKFDGESIKFAVCGPGVNSRSIDLGEDDDPDYEVNQQVNKRNSQVEEELGVDIVLEKVVNMQAMVGEMQPILASNIYTYDVLGLYQYFDLGLALGDTVGKFYNLLNMPEGYTNYLNLDAPYWSQTLLNTMSYKGVAFFVTGDLNQSYTGTMFVSYVNTKLWNQYASKIAALEQSGGYSDIYDLVKNGYWTLDLWIELNKMVYVDNGNTPGKPDYEDQVGLMTYNEQINNIMADMLVAGSNIHYGTLDADGTPAVAINTKQNVAFYNKLYTLLCDSNAATIPWLASGDEDVDDTYIMDVFAQGKTLMTVNTLHCAEQYLANMVDDFYVMPLPMFDHDQFDSKSASLGYTTQLGDSVNQYAICKAIGDEKIPAVTATLELMAYYSKLWVTPAYYETALKERYTRDERAPEMIDMIQKGIYTDFVFIWSNELDNITWKFRSNFTKGESQAATNLKSWHRTVQGKLNKLLPSIEEAFYVE